MMMLLTQQTDCVHAGLAMQVEEDAAASASQQQAQLLQESHTAMTAALEQVVMHGEAATNHLFISTCC